VLSAVTVFSARHEGVAVFVTVQAIHHEQSLATPVTLVLLLMGGVFYW
jgi:hypothetical protein